MIPTFKILGHKLGYPMNTTESDRIDRREDCDSSEGGSLKGGGR